MSIKGTGKSKYDHLLCNQIQTPDGTVLTSYHRHDYQTHEDKNGFTYMVDGGTDYLRRFVVADAPYVEQAEYYKTGDHAHNREYARWGTRGKKGDKPVKYKLIKDMSNKHLRATLSFCQGYMSGILKEVMRAEQKHRKLKVVKGQGTKLGLGR